MFIIHFVGDIHQPLHAEDNNDRGGNCVPADFLQTHTKETNATTPSLPQPEPPRYLDTQLRENVGGVTSRTSQSVHDDRLSVAREIVLKRGGSL